MVFRFIAMRILTFRLPSVPAGSSELSQCYDGCVFHFGRPSTPGQWIGHILAAIVALFLVWWMLRLFIV
jgi:hypothetical protein